MGMTVLAKASLQSTSQSELFSKISMVSSGPLRTLRNRLA